jgi:heme/copper-type cytochrome/quinol oxidase subunit 2
VLLFTLDKLVIDSSYIVVKVIGNQWYWSYEVGYQQPAIDFQDSFWVQSESFDSYMLEEKDLLWSAPFRLLEVDNCLLLPIQTPISIFITSSDVLHSWAVPSLGIKLDACPGRLNKFILLRVIYILGLPFSY